MERAVQSRQGLQADGTIHVVNRHISMSWLMYGVSRHWFWVALGCLGFLESQTLRTSVRNSLDGICGWKLGPSKALGESVFRHETKCSREISGPRGGAMYGIYCLLLRYVKVTFGYNANMDYVPHLMMASQLQTPSNPSPSYPHHWQR